MLKPCQILGFCATGPKTTRPENNPARKQPGPKTTWPENNLARKQPGPKTTRPENNKGSPKRPLS